MIVNWVMVLMGLSITDYIIPIQTLLAWGEKPSSKYVPKANAKKIIANCEAVLKWLKDAEEESEDEDEEDDEIDFQVRY